MQDGLEISIRCQFDLKIDVTDLELRREVGTRNGLLVTALSSWRDSGEKLTTKGDFGKNLQQALSTGCRRQDRSLK